MIVVAGLSPAWQQILVFDALRVGAVNRARQSQWCASGKVLNVGIGLAHLGARSLTISPLGGSAGAAIARQFAELDVPLEAIHCAAPTRVCTTILDRATGATTELVEETHPLSSNELTAVVAAISRACSRAKLLVLSGSLPAGVPSTLYRDLLASCNVPAVLDVRGPELLAALVHRPLIVKPNREELARTLGRDLATDEALLAGMRELNAGGAQWVVVTGGASAVWVTSTDASYRLVPPQVAQIENPIGCGDALTAGIACGIDRGLAVIDAVRLGMAAAADRLGRLLPGRLDPRAVEATFARIVAESV